MGTKLYFTSLLVLILACLCTVWLTKPDLSDSVLYKVNEWVNDIKKFTKSFSSQNEDGGVVLNDNETKEEESIIAAWNNFIKPPSKKFKRISVGINSCVDLIVRALPVFEALHIRPGSAKDHAILKNFDDLQETFSYFFSKGSAAERSYMNKEEFDKMVSVAENISNSQYFLGGNGLLMASKIATNFPEAEVQYIGPVGPKILELIPKKLNIPQESIFPHDEVHLILEYKVNDIWGDQVAPVANRFITSHDISNSEVSMMEVFFESLETYTPDLIVFSGLHLLDSQKPEFSKKRVEMMLPRLQSLPIFVPIHLELASMANVEFVGLVLKKVIPLITSLGLNEEELALLSYVGKGPHTESSPTLKVSHAGSSHNNQPEIHKVSDVILWLLKTYGHSRKSFEESRLTRIHFHSLTYHIVGTLPEAWTNSESAVAAGTEVAGRQACNIEQLESDKVELKIPKTFKLHSNDDKLREIDEKRPVISWDMEGYHFVFSPVLVCRHPIKTVGLGDAISSTGLMYSQFLTKYRL